ADAREVADAARREFDGLVNGLATAGVTVIVMEDTPDPVKPDAVFPNNWFSTHADGTAVLYPMLNPSRRVERQREWIEALGAEHGRRLSSVLDLSYWEKQGLALEGTGSLILDRVNQTAYACRAPRTSPEPLAQWASFMGYETHCFDAIDQNGVAIYHTNVMMSLGSGFVAVALDAVADSAEGKRLRQSLESAGKEVIPLSLEQIAGFGANILQLSGSAGEVIAMSESARSSLGSEVIRRLEAHGEIVSAPIPTIEQCGGGSVRCMLAEVFLPAS
ncbi:MAG TPA: arginine deiminase-related protein, partial [Gammaproteobacteria bacterium]|nr:arginine deiminase-related protein [Gammaproteobacteria bacterium]